MIDPQERSALGPSEVNQVGSGTIPHRKLSIAVLGPEIRFPLAPGGKKKQQLRDRLLQDGHRAFYPEEKMGPDGVLLRREVEMLSDSSVDLVIILQTVDSMSVAQELGAFVLVEDIVAKTAVFTPDQYYKPGQGLAANTVSQFRVHRPYSEEQFTTCHLVDICKWTVDEFLSEDSDLFIPRQE